MTDQVRRAAAVDALGHDCGRVGQSEFVANRSQASCHGCTAVGQTLLRPCGPGFGTDAWLEVTNGPDAGCAARHTVRV